MTRSRKTIPVFLTIFVDLLGFGIIIPILPLIAAEYPVPGIQGEGSRAGLLMFSYSLLQMLFSPLWGRLSDRIGGRPILLLSLAGSTTSYLLLALAHGYWTILLSRALAGVCAANIAAAQAYISDVTPAHKRTSGMALVGVAFGLGFALGPVIGGGATDIWWHIQPHAPAHIGPGLAAAAICGLNLLWAIIALPESLSRESRRGGSWGRWAVTRQTWAFLRHPTLGPLILLFFLITFAFANVEVSFSIYAKFKLGLDQRTIYALFVFIGFLMLLNQGYLVRKAVNYVPEQILAIVGITLLAVGLVILPVSPHLGWVLVALTILSLGQGLCIPCMLALISRNTGASDQGSVFGASQSAASLARIIGPIFGGLLFDAGPRLPFWAAAVLTAGGIYGAIYARRRIFHGAGRMQREKLGAPHWDLDFTSNQYRRNASP